MYQFLVSSQKRQNIVRMLPQWTYMHFARMPTDLVGVIHQTNITNGQKSIARKHAGMYL